MTKRPKTLLVVIDYDNDIGREGFKTPIKGYYESLKVAEEFGIRRPQDSDLNALFAALKIYRELETRGIDPEIVIISGSERGGLEAFQNIKMQLTQILSTDKYDSAIIVSDGGEDEKVYPLIQSMIPVEYIERVVVEQHRGIETTYIILWRYFRKVLEEPRLSKVLIGYPGIILLAFSVLALLNLLLQGVLVSLLILALLMIYRGFNLEEFIVVSWRKKPARTISYLSGLAVGLIAIAITYILVSSKLSVDASMLNILGSLFISVTWLYSLSITLPLIGEALDKIFKRSFSAWKYIMAIITVIIITILLSDLGNILLGLPARATAEVLISVLVNSRIIERILVALITIIIASSTLQLLSRIYYSRKRRKLS
ncbi:MAG: DUF373 family protein [Sulfolobales archaeon]